MTRNRITFLSLATLPGLVFAHGEGMLVTLYAELLTVTMVILVLRFSPRFRPFWLGGTISCIVGVIASWFATARMAYFANQALITAISVALPVLAAAAYLVWRRSRVVR